MTAQSIEECQIDRLLEWLPTQPPAVWHEIALGWNWDNGIGPLKWIIEQNTCDAGTAQHIFWLGNVDSFERLSDGRAEVSGHRVDLYDMLKTILRKWRSGEYCSWSYTTSNPFMVKAEDTLARSNPDFLIPASLTEIQEKPSTGVKLEMDEGIPLEITRKCYKDFGEPLPDWLKQKSDPSEFEILSQKLKDPKLSQAEYLDLCKSLISVCELKTWRREVDFASMTRGFADVRRELKIKNDFKASDDKRIFEQMVMMTNKVKDKYLARMEREFDVQAYPEHPDYVQSGFFAKFFKT